MHRDSAHLHTNCYNLGFYHIFNSSVNVPFEKLAKNILIEIKIQSQGCLKFNMKLIVKQNKNISTTYILLESKFFSFHFT